MVKHVERTFAGRALKLEAGRLAKQAAGSCLVQFGETVVLAAVTVSDNVSTLPFFPLTVEYREKAYAAGKIPGGFLKREGRPSDEEILAARVIDRSVRPLFPEGFKNEVQVFVYVLSADQENDADVLGVVAASTALSLSKVPWNGPIAAVRVGRVEGAWILNPTFQQLEFSDVDMVVSGGEDSIEMVEGGALELTGAGIVEGLEDAQKGSREVLDEAWALGGGPAARCACGRAPTARRCSPAARRRPSCRRRSVPYRTSSASTRSTWRRKRRSRSCCTTTSRRFPPVRSGRSGAPRAARWGTARWPNGRCRPCSHRTSSSPTPSASCPTSSSRTARRPWRRCAAARWRCSTRACR